jgi:Group II intron, maturase-specific domain
VKAVRAEIRSWNLHLRSDKSIEDLSRMFNPVIRGWLQYSGRFYRSALYPPMRQLDRSLARWADRKYKKLRRHLRRATQWVARISRPSKLLIARYCRVVSITICWTIAGLRKGVAPPKSHWAQKLDKPPFFGYPLRPGITFTYLSVKVNEKAEIQLREKSARANVFAAGEIMEGNILGKGYPAGFGMTTGSVFGRIAGKEAVRAARSKNIAEEFFDSRRKPQGNRAPDDHL